jgi:hypothetical protein
VKDYIEGKVIENPRVEIQMFSLCEGMNWSHLPVAGGLYDQHPDLLDAWRYIFGVRAEHEKLEQERRERESKRSTSRGMRGRR